MKTLVVVPTYNEAGNIVEVIRGIQDRCDADVLVVDDSSPDGTGKVVRGLGDEKVISIIRDRKRGIGSAYVTGFAWALNKGYDVIGQMDADLSHDPAELPSMIELIQDNDLVVGSRYVPGGKIVGWGLWRHFCSRSASFVSRLLLRLKIKDATSGYRIWRADLIKTILSKPIRSKGYAFQEEMLFYADRLGAKIVEHPIVFVDRKHGRSKLGVKDVLEFVRIILTLRRIRGRINELTD